MQRQSGVTEKPATTSLFDDSALWWVAAWVLLVASICVRVFVYPVVTSDYTYFLSKWFDTLSTTPGLSAFQHPFSDYSPLYLYLIKLLTLVPVPSLYSIKTLSLVFDACVAFVTYCLLRDAPAGYTRGQRFLIAVGMFSIPTVVINSSLWGQSDAVYAAGVLASFYFIVRDKPFWAAVFFGLGISIKLQAIFFFPVLLGYLLRKHVPQYVFIIPVLYVLSLVPAWIGGGPFGDLLLTYFSQSKEYPWLNVSSQSIYAFVNNLPLTQHWIDVLFWAGIALAAAAALWVVWVVASARELSVRTLTFMSLMSVLLIPYLLPRMHERYFYLGDLFALLYAVYAPRRWYVPVLVILISLMSYMPFLSGQVGFFSPFHIDLRLPSALLLVVLLSLAPLAYRCVRFELVPLRSRA